MFRQRHSGWVLIVSILLAATSMGRAQRGMGDSAGIAQRAVKPDAAWVDGRIVSVETGPCAKTTGRSSIGTHVILRTSQGDECNMHLGPAGMVREAVESLTEGDSVRARVFRTDAMPQGHCVCIEMISGGKTVVLRDDGLRPVWAGRMPRGVDTNVDSRPSAAPGESERLRLGYAGGRGNRGGRMPASVAPPARGTGRRANRGPQPMAGRGRGWGRGFGVGG